MLPSMSNTLLLILTVFEALQLPYISLTISYEWVSVGEWWITSSVLIREIIKLKSSLLCCNVR